MTGGADTADQINRDLQRSQRNLASVSPLAPAPPPLQRIPQATWCVMCLSLVLAISHYKPQKPKPLRSRPRPKAVQTPWRSPQSRHGVVQPEGDQDFAKLDTTARLVEGLSVPIIVKETGCGLSRLWENDPKMGSMGRCIGRCTSWVAVETHRADRNEMLGETRDGNSTAASVLRTGLGLGRCHRWNAHGPRCGQGDAIGATCGALPAHSTGACSGRR